MPTKNPAEKKSASDHAGAVGGAARDLHNAVYAAWSAKDTNTLIHILEALGIMESRCTMDGTEIGGWDGSCVSQSGSLLAVIGLIEGWLPGPCNPPMRPAPAESVSAENSPCETPNDRG